MAPLRVNTQTPDSRPSDPLAYSVENAAKRLGIGRTSAFELIRSGRLTAVRLGRRTLIPEASLRALLDSLPRI